VHTYRLNFGKAIQAFDSSDTVERKVKRPVAGKANSLQPMWQDAASKSN
jgi:hypothetical protein